MSSRISAFGRLAVSLAILAAAALLGCASRVFVKEPAPLRGAGAVSAFRGSTLQKAFLAEAKSVRAAITRSAECCRENTAVDCSRFLDDARLAWLSVGKASVVFRSTLSSADKERALIALRDVLPNLDYCSGSGAVKREGR